MQKEITVHIWPSADGLPSSSPYCNKVLRALNYKKLPHEIKVAVNGSIPKWARHDKLPVAEIAGAQIEDSTWILQAVDAKFQGASRLYPTDPLLRADTLVVEHWADEVLTPYVPYYRWVVEERGIALDTETERQKQFRENIWILEQKLAKNPFLITSYPTAADFAVHSVLEILLHGKIHEIAPIIEQSAPVMKWMKALESA